MAPAECFFGKSKSQTKLCKYSLFSLTLCQGRATGVNVIDKRLPAPSQANAKAALAAYHPLPPTLVTAEAGAGFIFLLVVEDDVRSPDVV